MSKKAYVLQCTDQRTGRREERTVQADSPEAASAQVRELGYSVQSVQEEAPVASGSPQGRRGLRGDATVIPVAIAGVAMLLAVAALIVALAGGGGGLHGYNFATPQGAVKALAEINARMDLPAMLALQRACQDSKRTRECVSSLKFEGEPLEFKSPESDSPYRVVLYSLEDRDGTRRFKHMVLYKNDSGMWLPHHNALDDVLRPQYSKAESGTNVRDQEISKKISEWESKSR